MVFVFSVLRMWKRQDGQSIEEVILQNEPCELTLKDEYLGESVAIRGDNSGFVTVSEGANAAINFYEDN